MGEAALRFRIFISSFSYNLFLFLQEGGRNNALDIAFELLTLLRVLTVVEMGSFPARTSGGAAGWLGLFEEDSFPSLHYRFTGLVRWASAFAANRCGSDSM